MSNSSAGVSHCHARLVVGSVGSRASFDEFREAGRSSACSGRRSALRKFPHVPETQVTEIWLRIVAEGRRLPLSGGGDVLVLEAGRKNIHDGPDFLNARVECGGAILCGDVEVHTCEDDWRKHGHDTDERYKSVILHVALYPSAGSAVRQPAATVILCDVLRRPLRAVWAEVLQEWSSKPPVLCGYLNRLPRSDLAYAMIALASAERFARKTSSVRRRIEALSAGTGAREAREQVFYELSARCFGYGGNQELFETIAGSITLQRLLSMGRRNFRDIAEMLSDAALSQALKWNARAVRPANSVRLRIEQLAAWTAALLEGALLECLAERLIDTAHSHESLLGVIRRSFEHSAVKATGIPGRSRCVELLVNVLCPFFATTAATDGNRNLLSASLLLYHRFPNAPQNRKTRELAAIFSQGSCIQSGVQQGLIEIHDMYCMQTACNQCLINR